MSVSAVSGVQNAPPPQPVKPVSQVKGSDPDRDGDVDPPGGDSAASSDPYSGKTVDVRA